jgi:hypothetical protein
MEPPAVATPSAVRAAVYLWVNTTDQTTENQRQALAKVATARDWVVVDTCEDHVISGTRSRNKHPQLDAPLKVGEQARCDLLIPWTVIFDRSLEESCRGPLGAAGGGPVPR